ncbi:MAG: DUF1670 domain-containing protein [Candidatus Methylomirabilales bacterium]
MKPPPSRIVDYRRLARRNLPGLLRYKFLHEYGYDKGPVVVAAIVADICETVRTYYRREGDLEPGQLIYLAPAIGERAGRGKTIGRTRLVPVRLSIVADEDLEAIRRGLRQAERRIIRVRRLAREAHEQGGLLSERDIGIVTGYSPGAVSLSAVTLRGRGEFLPLRGYLMDMGSFPTHKAAIIRLYLDGMLTPDIARRTYHSKEAVDRYIRGFERVRLLASKFANEELPLLSGMGERLVEEYLRLLADYRPQEVKSGVVVSS